MPAPVYSGVFNLNLGAYRAAIYPGASGFASAFSEPTGFFVNSNNATATARVVGKLPGTALDLSTSGGILLFSATQNGGQFSSTVDAILRLILYSGSDTSPENRREILLNRASASTSSVSATARPLIRAPSSGGEFAISMASALPTSVGAFNPADVRLVEYLMESAVAQNVTMRISNLFWIPTLTAVSGDSSTPAKIDGLRSYIVGVYGNGSAALVKVHAAFQTNKSIQVFPCSIRIGDGNTPTYFEDLVLNLFFQTGITSTEYTADRFTDIQIPNGELIFRLSPSSSDTIRLFGSIACDGGFRFIVDSFTGNPTVRMGLNLTDAVNTILLRPGVVFTGSLTRCGELQCNGATVSGVAISASVGASGYLFESGGTTTGISISGCAIGARVAVAGDYSTRTVTLANNTTADLTIDSGVTGSINLSGCTFASGSTSPVNIRYMGTGAVTVNVLQSGLTTATPNGGTITLVTPLVIARAPSFADGVRAHIAHRQVFTIASTAIDTTANAIALGNDSNGDAANFRTTSPNTLIRFSLASGATIPASTPQIFDGGLYYWKAGGQLSTSESGVAIDFTSQGSGNFVLVAETEISNAVVSGGSGLSVDLERSANAAIRVKAVHWSESGGVAKSSRFFDQVFAWSAVAGLTIPDVVNNAVASSQDAIHEQIVALNEILLGGSIQTASGTVITSVSPANSGQSVPGLSLALEGVGRIQMNANDADGILAWQDLYLWGCFVRSTAAGIRLASADTFIASDIFNFVFQNLEFDNTGSIPLAIVGGIGRSADGSSVIAAGSGSIALNALSQGTGAITSSGGGGLDAAGVRSAVGLATANLDTQLSNLHNQNARIE